MANAWDHPDMLAAEALVQLQDALVITNLCAIDKTSEFSKTANGWAVGDTISFRTNGDYEVDEFTSSIRTQPIQSSRRSMLIEKHLDVSVTLTARELALDLDSFVEQVISQAAYRLAEKCDAFVASKILGARGMYTSTALFDTVADVALARKYATEQQLSRDRYCVVDLETEANLLGQEWFNRADSRGAAGVTTLQSAIMGRVMGMDWFSTGGFPTVTGAVQGTGVGTTVAADPTKNQIGMDVLSTVATTGTFKAGDRIIVAGMKRPMIVKTETAATATSIPLTEQINELVPAGAAITVVASGKTVDIHGAIFDSRSLAVAFPALDVPGSPFAASASNNGVSVRIVRDYNIDTKKTTMSMDLLIGAFALDPRRITLVGKRNS